MSIFEEYGAFKTYRQVLEWILEFQEKYIK